MKTEWRFIADCPFCGEAIDLGPAPSPEEKDPATHAGVLLDCPHCGGALELRPGQVSRGLVDVSDK